MSLILNFWRNYSLYLKYKLQSASIFIVNCKTIKNLQNRSQHLVWCKLWRGEKDLEFKEMFYMRRWVKIRLQFDYILTEMFNQIKMYAKMRTCGRTIIIVEIMEMKHNIFLKKNLSFKKTTIYFNVSEIF